MATIADRHYERVPFSVDLEVQRVADGKSFAARSIELSRDGIEFFARKFIASGAAIRLVFLLKQDGQTQPVVLNATVREARMEAGGVVMSAQFEAVLSRTAQPLLCERLDRK
ncbi:MAG TPA: PilZ domain-containing protein [Phycisphaerae bacterium]|nr:PilZ domain-containing protein [Phycisphaerae bacterium]